MVSPGTENFITPFQILISGIWRSLILYLYALYHFGQLTILTSIVGSLGRLCVSSADQFLESICTGQYYLYLKFQDLSDIFFYENSTAAAWLNLRVMQAKTKS